MSGEREVGPNVPARPPVRDRQHKAKANKPTGLARVRVENGLVTCSCGAEKFHPREKVREDWIDKHFTKAHKGRGIRL